MGRADRGKGWAVAGFLAGTDDRVAVLRVSDGQDVSVAHQEIIEIVCERGFSIHVGSLQALGKK